MRSLKILRICFVSFTILAFHQMLFAQVEWTKAEETVNVELWLPFISAYNNLDVEAFMGVHDQDFIRVLRDSDEIFGKSDYAERMEASTKHNRESGRVRNLALSFHERIIGEDKGFETGIYRVNISEADGTNATYFGKFHTALTRGSGKWQLLLDADGSLAEEEGKKLFTEGKVLELL